jgi:hemin uptake protein HemP
MSAAGPSKAAGLRSASGGSAAAKAASVGAHDCREVSEASADRGIAINAGALRAGEPEADTSAPRIIESDQLMRGASLVAIRHEKRVYILRKTRFGKLILTK